MSEYRALKPQECWELPGDVDDALDQRLMTTDTTVVLVLHDGRWYARTTTPVDDYWVTSDVVLIPGGPGGMIDTLVYRIQTAGAA